MFFPKQGAWIQVKKKVEIKNAPEPLSIYFATFEKGYFERPVYEMDMPFGWNKFFAGANSQEDFVRCYFQYEWGNKKGLSEMQKKVIEHFKEYNCDSDITVKVKVQTKDGDIYLLSHEFNIVDVEKYVDCVDGEHCVMNFFSETASLPKKMSEQIFYMRSRGIPYIDALKMLSGNIKKSGIFWITFHKEYQRMFVG